MLFYLLIQNIFDAIKSDLTNLAKELALAFLRQRGIDYLSTLKSLLGILGLFGGGSGGCFGVLDKLLALLKLSNFGPMPMLPPPLILVAGGIKPGMNSVALINDIKASLTEKGIETAPTLPDGTPNNMIIAIEETVKTMVSHIKTNSTIQTFGIGAMGPVSGYGQIQTKSIVLEFTEVLTELEKTYDVVYDELQNRLKFKDDNESGV